MSESTAETLTMKGVADRKEETWTLEICIAGLALLALLAAQGVLASAIQGTNYYGGDGKMAQAVALVALKFGGLLDITNLSPVAGIGSQLLPKNVWGNPALWPFHVFDKEIATDISALIALGCYALGCYLMCRCFDMPIVPSALAAQLCIGLFAPALLLVYTPTNFCLTPGDAVVYAPYMIALGLLARLEPGVSRKTFAVLTAAILLLLIYSIYCDPLWATVAAFGWSVPFAVVTFSALRLKAILIRLASLACCFGLLVASGAMIYLYTLSQYTARVQFAEALDRARVAGYVLAMTYWPNMTYFYPAWIVAWSLGLFCLRGRSRTLVIAAIAGFAVYVVYGVSYLLLNTKWPAPIPIYVEHCLFPLYLAGAIAGLWGALSRMAALADRLAWRVVEHIRPVRTADDFRSAWPDLIGFGGTRQSRRSRFAYVAFALVILSIIPIYTIHYALADARSKARLFYEPWPNEPEAVQFFVKNIGQDTDTPFRGWVHFYTFNIDTGFTGYLLWTRGVGTIAEYSQLVAPQGVYFIHKLFQQDITNSLNGFVPFPGASGDRFWKALQMFG